jgi:hypothetical protein
MNLDVLAQDFKERSPLRILLRMLAAVLGPTLPTSAVDKK